MCSVTGDLILTLSGERISHVAELFTICRTNQPSSSSNKIRSTFKGHMVDTQSMMAEGEHGNKMVASDQETGQILQVTIFKEQFATNSRLRTDNTGAGANEIVSETMDKSE